MEKLRSSACQEFRKFAWGCRPPSQAGFLSPVDLWLLCRAPHSHVLAWPSSLGQEKPSDVRKRDVTERVTSLWQETRSLFSYRGKIYGSLRHKQDLRLGSGCNSRSALGETQILLQMRLDCDTGRAALTATTVEPLRFCY